MTTVCGIPGGPHAGPVRLYPAGPRCTAHSPAATAGHPQPPTTPIGENR